jgi:hypothetical protein
MANNAIVEGLVHQRWLLERETRWAEEARDSARDVLLRKQERYERLADQLRRFDQGCVELGLVEEMQKFRADQEPVL